MAETKLCLHLVAATATPFLCYSVDETGDWTLLPFDNLNTICNPVISNLLTQADEHTIVIPVLHLLTAL